jgi:hypothetical protein
MINWDGVLQKLVRKLEGNLQAMLGSSRTSVWAGRSAHSLVILRNDFICGPFQFKIVIELLSGKRRMCIIFVEDDRSLDNSLRRRRKGGFCHDRNEMGER